MTAGQFVSAADINAGHLTFVADANENGTPYANFTFQVQDNGGTANGGVDLDQSANTFTINVTSVNDAPSGADNVKTINEDADLYVCGGGLWLQRSQRQPGERAGGGEDHDAGDATGRSS